MNFEDLQANVYRWAKEARERPWRALLVGTVFALATLSYSILGGYGRELGRLIAEPEQSKEFAAPLVEDANVDIERSISTTDVSDHGAEQEDSQTSEGAPAESHGLQRHSPNPKKCLQVPAHWYLVKEFRSYPKERWADLRALYVDQWVCDRAWFGRVTDLPKAQPSADWKWSLRTADAAGFKIVIWTNDDVRDIRPGDNVHVTGRIADLTDSYALLDNAAVSAQPRADVPRFIEKEPN